MMKTIISNQTYDQERALYNTSDALIIDCKFEGEADGESALKESHDIKVDKCLFALRYPLWHVANFELTNSMFLEASRAPLWYCSKGIINNIQIKSVKALRECSHIVINNSNITSEEFGWKCNDIRISNTSIEAFYFLFESKNIEISNLELKGKYSFQYVDNMVIKDSKLDTKDAFWHSRNVTVVNSIIKGEYLGWFSDGLTIINCKIIGTQPLCYCKNLKIIDSEMLDSDLSFEYSEVEANIIGHIDSIKNPKSGNIVVDSVGEIIKSGSKIKSNAKIIVKSK